MFVWWKYGKLWFWVSGFERIFIDHVFCFWWFGWKIYIVHVLIAVYVFIIIIVIVLNLVFRLFDDVWHFGSPFFGAFESEIAFSWSKVLISYVCLLICRIKVNLVSWVCLCLSLRGLSCLDMDPKCDWGFPIMICRIFFFGKLHNTRPWGEVESWALVRW